MSSFETQHEQEEDIENDIPFQYEVGATVSSKWKLNRYLGGGAFGKIFECLKVEEENISEEIKFAIKIQTRKISEKYGNRILRREASLMKKLENYSFFCKPINLSKDSETNCDYLVMTRHGKNLLSLLKFQKLNKFSLPTSIGIGIQGVRSIQCLHEIGYIHRDIKPSNFIVREDIEAVKDPFLILIDFGLTRKLANKNDDKKTNDKTKVSGFRGTPRYASIKAHELLELQRADDLWSLFYTLVEISTGEIPWKNMKDRDKIFAEKKAFSSEQKVQKLVPFLKNFFIELKKIKDNEIPNYEIFVSLLEKEYLKIGCEWNESLDWKKKIEKPKDFIKNFDLGKKTGILPTPPSNPNRYPKNISSIFKRKFKNSSKS